MSVLITRQCIYTFPEAALELLRVVHDALDIPLPDTTDVDERAYAALLGQRSQDARIILACVLDKGHEAGPAAEALRDWTARAPVTYAPWSDAR